MIYHIHKLTYSEGRAYRYRVTDEAGEVRYIAEPTGAFLPVPTRLVTLFDAGHRSVGRIEPAPPSPWRWVREYTLVLADDQRPYATIEERWTLVDRILLRLPSYLIHIGDHTYIAQGNRHGERFYELFLRLPEEEEPEEPPPSDELSLGEAAEEIEEDEGLRRGEKVGEVLRPPVGPNYIVEVEAAPLRQAPLVLTAVAVLADMHLHGR